MILDDASLDASKDNAWSPNGDDDSWIDDWDFVIRRCTTCDRPFRTEARLRTHVREYHDNPSAKTLPQYRSPKQLREITSPGERPERVDIISSGDLEIVTSTTVIRVASQVLWTASPVFNAMFGPQSTYSEAKNLKLAALDSDTRAVITVDDNPIALRTVLEVLHHKRVYTTFTFDQLVRIAEVADKYQIAPIIKPRMEKWIQLFEPIILTPGYEDALTISWVFGLDTLFQKITKGFGARAVVDENGQLLLKDSHGKRVEFSDSLPEIALSKGLHLLSKAEANYTINQRNLQRKR